MAIVFEILKAFVLAALGVFFLSGAVRTGARLVRGDPAGNLAAVQEAVERPRGEINLAELLEPIRAKFKVPGLGAIVLTDGEVAAIGATGVRKAGGSTPVTSEDLWHIGSCTKAMTAMLIAKLVEEGKLAWEMKVGEFFQGRLEEIDAAWKEVTLEHLLANRGGAPAELNRDGLWGRLWSFKGSPREARMELARGVLKHPPVHAAGGTFLYSNAGYAIAGAMAEEAMEAAWEELMRERLFEPLGMSGGFGAPGTAGQEDQPWGHTGGNKAVSPGPQGDNPPAIGPAGTVHCTLADWAKFVREHLRGYRGESPYLSRESFAKLHTPAEGPGEKYALGWLVTTRPWAKGENGRGLALTHAGSNTMWFAVAWVAPERDFAVLVMCNQGGNDAAKAADAVAGAVIGRFLKE